MTDFLIRRGLKKDSSIISDREAHHKNGISLLQNILFLVALIGLYYQPLGVLAYILTGTSLNFAVLRLLFLVLGAAGILVYGKLNWPTLNYVLLFLFSAVFVILLHPESVVNIQDIAGILIMPLSVILSLSCRHAKSRHEQWATIAVVLGMAFWSLFGYAQYIMNQPLFLQELLRARNLDLYNINYIWEFQQHVRAFSLFYSNGYYAFFLNLAFCITTAFGILAIHQRERSKAIFWLGLSIFFIVAVYTSLTRTALLQVALALAILLAIATSLNHRRMKDTSRKKSNSLLLRTLLLSAISIGGLLWLASSVRTTQEYSRSLSNTQSLSVRFGNWNALTDYFSKHPRALFLGEMITSNEVMTSSSSLMEASGERRALIVDNGYLALLIFGGLPYLLLVLSLQIYVLREVVGDFLHSQSGYALGMIAFLASAFLYNYFGSMNDMIALVSVFYLVTSVRKRAAKI